MILCIIMFPLSFLSWKTGVIIFPYLQKLLGGLLHCCEFHRWKVLQKNKLQLLFQTSALILSSLTYWITLTQSRKSCHYTEDDHWKRWLSVVIRAFIPLCSTPFCLTPEWSDSYNLPWQWGTVDLMVEQAQVKIRSLQEVPISKIRKNGVPSSPWFLLNTVGWSHNPLSEAHPPKTDLSYKVSPFLLPSTLGFKPLNTPWAERQKVPVLNSPENHSGFAQRTFFSLKPVHRTSERDVGTTGHYRLKVLQQPGINTWQGFINKALIG